MASCEIITMFYEKIDICYPKKPKPDESVVFTVKSENKERKFTLFLDERAKTDDIIDFLEDINNKISDSNCTLKIVEDTTRSYIWIGLNEDPMKQFSGTSLF